MRAQFRLLILLLTSGALTLLSGAPAFGQQAPAATEAHAAKNRGTGADPNIKVQSAPNDSTAYAPAPASKGGEKSRGTGSWVHFDNATGLLINVYVDGSYCGTVSGWGDVYCYVASGNRTVYARADYTNGTYTYWGPYAVYVDGTYAWRLHL